MIYLLSFLAVAGIFNPLILFHTDLIGRKVTWLQLIRYGLFLNVFGFILVPVSTILYHIQLSRARKRTAQLKTAPKKPGRQLAAVPAISEPEDTKAAVTNADNFTTPGNKTVH